MNSQIALEYGQAMTVRVLKADGEVMRESLVVLLIVVYKEYVTNFLQWLLPQP